MVKNFLVRYLFLIFSGDLRKNVENDETHKWSDDQIKREIQNFFPEKVVPLVGECNRRQIKKQSCGALVAKIYNLGEMGVIIIVLTFFFKTIKTNATTTSSVITLFFIFG